VALVEKKTERLATLLSDVVALRGEVVGGRSIYRVWRGRIERPDFAASALDFAHYLAFRRIDLRSLQRRLMVLGLSSLGRYRFVDRSHALGTGLLFQIHRR
jgi:pyruvate kinase